MQFANNSIQMITRIGQPQGQVCAWFVFVIGQGAQSKQASHLFFLSRMFTNLFN